MNRINIDNNEKKVNISLSKKFYDLWSIEEGRKDFEKFCDVCIKDTQDRFVLTLKPVRGNASLSVLGHEFCNYVFSIMKNNGVKW